MQKAKSIVLLTLLVLAFLPATIPIFQTTLAAPAYTEYTGKIAGTNYTIRIPSPIQNWNKDLVIFCRGYSPTEVLRFHSVSQNAPLDAAVAQGYAVAMSSLGAGYCVKKGMDATLQLTQHVITNYSVTGKVFLAGISMGGGIALLLGEKYPNIYSGIVEICAAKNITNSYTSRVSWPKLSDAELTAEFTALNSPIPPYLFPNFTVLRNWATQCSAFIAAETGGTPANVSKAYEDISPVYHANIAIPVISVQGTSDILAPLSTALAYQDAIIAAGKGSFYRLYKIQGGQHGDPPVVNELIPRLLELDAWSDSLQQNWTLVTDSRPLKAYPYLKEFVWEKNASMPPNGQYDKIGLHRLVKTGTSPKGVVFLTNCPMWGTGEQRISNPTSDSWTKYENFSQAIYWANRGFDVFAIDYRTHFAPKGLNASQYSFAAEWGLDVWVSDIKEAAEKVKQVSGNQKFFIAAECTGGVSALNYATKYWRTDLQGIILLDPNFYTVGYPVVGRLNETNTFNLTAAINSMNTNRNWTFDPYAVFKPVFAYALQNPGAPAQSPTGAPLNPATNPATNSTWANITEWATYHMRNVNVIGASGEISQVEYAVANAEWLPWRTAFEMMAMNNWVNCPSLTYDYNDHYNDIGVPLLAFDSGLFSNRTGAVRFVNGIGNTDFTAVMLPTYGHLDIYMGTNSARDVSQPALDWMLSHTYTLDVTAFSSVTLLSGWKWNFFVHNLGGNAPYTYQWYEGLNPIQGQTWMMLPVTKSTPGTYSFYCRVTDRDGTTTTSNAVTLRVIG